MKRKSFAALLVLIVASMMPVGCNSDSDYTVEVSGDCIISAARLGTLTRTIHTLNSAGEDSTYTANVTGSYYPIYIDHNRRLVYNGDSLPTGTDVSRVTFALFSTSGTAAIRSLDTGEDTLFSSTDSTDFRQARYVTVYATDGSAKRTYEVRVNVHQEEGEEFRWTHACTANAQIAALEEQRAIAAEGQLWVFGRENGNPVLLKATSASPGSWQRTPVSVAGDDGTTGHDLDVRSVQRIDGTFWSVSEGRIVRSADGIGWTPVAANVAPQAIVAAGSRQLVAVGGGKVYASADGINWTEEEKDTDGEMPTGNFAATLIPSVTDPMFEDILLTGTYAGEAVVWKHNIDLTGNEQFPWTYYPAGDDNPYNLPVLGSPSLATYDGASLLAGLDGEGSVGLYLSRDNGRTWKTGEIESPEGTGRPTSLSLCVDSDHFIWIVCGGTGDVWRGRLNRLGWDEPPTSFLKARKR